MLVFLRIAGIITTLLLSPLALASHDVNVTEIVVDDFTNGLDPKWKEKSFTGHTLYAATYDNGRPCIKSISNGTASGLYYELDFDPNKFPLLRWEWKVNNIISKGNAFSKDSDDYAASIYVAFPDVFFWNTKVIAYVWANKLPKDHAITNANTDNFMVVAVQSGSELTGQWITEERNIYEDYKRFFGKEPPRVGAVGFMTDTDDTGGQASAWFGTFILRNKTF